MPFLLLGSVSFVAWFISMLAGGGSPLILIPVVNGLLGAQAIAPVITIGMLVGSTQRAFVFRRQIDVSVTLWSLPGAISGAVLGAYTFTQIHLDWLQLLMGLVLLVMGLNYWLGRQEPLFQICTWHFLPLSFLSAFVSGLIGSIGPVMNPVYLSYGLDKENLIATKSASVMVAHGVKLVTYAMLGALTTTHLSYGLTIGLAAIPANWLGKKVLRKMSSQQFRQVVLTFVALSGLWMLWGQRQLLAW